MLIKRTKIRVAIITNIITTYREGFYDRLFKRDDLDIRVFCQEHIPGMNLLSIHEKYNDKVIIIKAISARREKVGWQFMKKWMGQKREKILSLILPWIFQAPVLAPVNILR